MKSDCSYAVVFTGRTLPGHDLADARRLLSLRLKLAPAQADRLFTGGRITVRRGLSLEQAERYRAVFEQAGARCDLLPERSRNLASEAAGTAPPLSTAQVDGLFAGAAEPPAALPLARRLQITCAAGAMALAAGLYFLVLAAVPAAALLLLVGAVSQFGRAASLSLLFLQLLSGLLLAAVSVAWLRPVLRRSPAAEVVPVPVHGPLRYFVERVAALIGAPPPQDFQLEVRPQLAATLQARASWRQPSYQLTLGMPLILGLDSRQLGAALAHELSSLVPVKGWRRAWLIRHLHRWSMQPAPGGDPWIERLRFWQARLPGAVRPPIGAAIRLLKATSRLQNRFKRLLSRLAGSSMWVLEMRADDVAAQFAGSADFRAAALALRRLQRGFADAHALARAGWPDRRLPADLTELTLRCMPQNSAALADGTGPAPGMAATADRIRRIEAREQPGLMRQAVSARRLLPDAAALAQACTRAFYDTRQELPQDGCRLIDTAACLEDARRRQEAAAALKRYFLGLWSVRRFLPVANLEAALVRTAADRARGLRQTLAALHQAAPLHQRRLERYQAVCEERFRNVPAAIFGRLVRNFEAYHRQQRLQKEIAALNGEMAEVDSLFADRLSFGLAQAISRARQPAAMQAEVTALLAAQAQLVQQQDRYRQLAEVAVALEALLAPVGSGPRVPEHVQRTTRQALAEHIQAINSMLVRTRNPFPHGEAQGDLLDMLSRQLPPYDSTEGPRQAMVYAAALGEGLDGLHRRLMGRLAALASGGERALENQPPRPSAASA